MQTTIVAKTFRALGLALAGIVFSLACEPAAIYAAPREAAVILTPKPAAAPRINGARVFGVRPGSPFPLQHSRHGPAADGVCR